MAALDTASFPTLLPRSNEDVPEMAAAASQTMADADMVKVVKVLRDAAAEAAKTPGGSHWYSRILGWLLGGAAALVLGVAAGGGVSQDELAATEQRITAQLAAVNGRVDGLETVQVTANEALSLAATGADIAIITYRYTTDILVDVARLDHPNYKPPEETERMARLLRSGQNKLDNLADSR